MASSSTEMARLSQGEPVSPLHEGDCSRSRPASLVSEGSETMVVMLCVDAPEPTEPARSSQETVRQEQPNPAEQSARGMPWPDIVEDPPAAGLSRHPEPSEPPSQPPHKPLPPLPPETHPQSSSRASQRSLSMPSAPRSPSPPWPFAAQVSAEEHPSNDSHLLDQFSLPHAPAKPPDQDQLDTAGATAEEHPGNEGHLVDQFSLPHAPAEPPAEVDTAGATAQEYAVGETAGGDTVGETAEGTAVSAKTRSKAKTNRKKKTGKRPPKMFVLRQDSKLFGPGHILLNVLRGLNLIGLAAVMMASMVMPILSGRNGHFFFFDMITHVFVFLFAAVLFVSELPVPWRWLKGWFEGTWPVLGPKHSLAWLGVGMIFIGFQILGDLWKPAYVVETIGLEWWRAIVAASILSITFGFFNIIVSVIFRTETHTGIIVTVRQIRAHGAEAVDKAILKNELEEEEKSLAAATARSHPSPPHTDHHWPRPTGSYAKEVGDDNNNNDDDVGASAAVRRLTRAFISPNRFSNFNFRKSRIQISKPIPQDFDVQHHHDVVDVERGYTSHSHGSGHGSRHDGDEDRTSPIIPGVVRPPTAQHPAIAQHSAVARYAESHYSVANLDRF